MVYCCSTCFPALDLCCAEAAQPATTAGEELDDLQWIDHDLAIRGAKYSH